MKKFFSIIAVVAISITLAGCGSNGQANAIKRACELASENDFDGTSSAFMLIAREDSNYLNAAKGARLWATAKGQTQAIDISNVSAWDDIRSFFTLCDLP